MTFGLSAGSGFGVWVAGPTLYWRHVMLVPASVSVDLFHLLPFIGWGADLKTMVGLGGFQGATQRLSHWGILAVGVRYDRGNWLPAMKGSDPSMTHYVSMILLAGYDLRWRSDERYRRVYGLRVFVGWLPIAWSRYVDAPCLPTESIYCSHRAPRPVAPVVAGVSFFAAFR